MKISKKLISVGVVASLFAGQIFAAPSSTSGSPTTYTLPTGVIQSASSNLSSSSTSSSSGLPTGVIQSSNNGAPSTSTSSGGPSTSSSSSSGLPTGVIQPSANSNNGAPSTSSSSSGGTEKAFGEFISGGEGGGASGYRFWKNYDEWGKLGDSRLSLKSYTREFTNFDFQKTSSSKVLKLKKDGVTRVVNKIVIKNNSDISATEIKFKRAFESEGNCMDVKVIGKPSYDYDEKKGEFTFYMINGGETVDFTYTLELKPKDSTACRGVEILKILDSSLNENYKTIYNQPQTIAFIQSGSDMSYQKDGFQVNMYKDLSSNSDEVVVTATFENISGFDKKNVKFIFNYESDEVKIIRAIGAKRSGSSDIYWERGYVKNGELVKIMFKVKVSEK